MVNLHCPNFHVSSISLSRDTGRGQICPNAYADTKEPRSNRVKATLIYIFSRGTGQFSPGQLPPPGQLAPGKLPPRIIVPRITAHQTITPEQFPPRKIPPR